jgi:probable F420-dependent oxidoreductase
MSILVGALLFPTQDTMPGPDLVHELELRGFESLWVAEHSHIPVSTTPVMSSDGVTPLADVYFRPLDPFVYLATAAVADSTVMLGTAVCLVVQRDPIQTAKLVASLDVVSGGRFLFGVGAGWLEEEMRNHGTEPSRRFKLLRERIEAMKAVWTNETAEYRGEFVNFGPMQAWPKPIQRPYPPLLVGGTWPGAAERALRYGNGWLPRSDVPDLVDRIPDFRRRARDAGLDASVTVLIVDPAHIERIEAAQPDRIIVGVPSADGDRLRGALDRYADFVARNTS